MLLRLPVLRQKSNQILILNLLKGATVKKKTKRNTVNKGILVSKKVLVTYKKVCFDLEKVWLQRKEICAHRKNVYLHTQKNYRK